MYRRTLVQAISLVALAASSADAFLPSPRTGRPLAVGTTSTTTTQQFLTPDMLPDVITSTKDVLESSSYLIAADDGSWWASYLEIFKNTLSFVHSTIDGPLRSVGIDQTWGVSIAVFTFREFMHCFYWKCDEHLSLTNLLTVELLVQCLVFGLLQ
jgi:hypothetical protein